MDSNGAGPSSTLGRPALLALAAAGVLLLMSLAPTVAADGRFPLQSVEPSGCVVGAVCPSESASDMPTASATSSEAPSASDTGCFDVTGKPVACPSGSAAPTDTALPTESTLPTDSATPSGSALPSDSTPPTDSATPTGSADASSSVGVTPPATTTGSTPGGSGSALALALVLLSLGAGSLVLFGSRTGVRRRR